MAAVGGGVTAGLNTGEFSSYFNEGVPGAIEQAAVGNAVTQGIGIATGMQEKFSWTQVAASAAGAGISAELGESVGKFGRSLGLGQYANNIFTGTTLGLINGGAQSLITHERPNWGAIAAQSFGQSLGSALGNKIAAIDAERGQVALHEQNQQKAAELTGADVNSYGEANNLQYGFAFADNGLAQSDVGTWRDQMYAQAARASRSDAPYYNEDGELVLPITRGNDGIKLDADPAVAAGLEDSNFTLQDPPIDQPIIRNGTTAPIVVMAQGLSDPLRGLGGRNDPLTELGFAPATYGADMKRLDQLYPSGETPSDKVSGLTSVSRGSQDISEADRKSELLSLRKLADANIPYDELDCSHAVQRAMNNAGLQIGYVTSNGDGKKLGFDDVMNKWQSEGKPYWRKLGVNEAIMDGDLMRTSGHMMFNDQSIGGGKNIWTTTSGTFKAQNRRFFESKTQRQYQPYRYVYGDKNK